MCASLFWSGASGSPFSLGRASPNGCVAERRLAGADFRLTPSDAPTKSKLDVDANRLPQVRRYAPHGPGCGARTIRRLGYDVGGGTCGCRVNYGLHRADAALMASFVFALAATQFKAQFQARASQAPQRYSVGWKGWPPRQRLRLSPKQFDQRAISKSSVNSFSSSHL